MIHIEDIQKVLDEKVRPELSSHGGDIEVIELQEDTLKVRMKGQCSGCPSASITMEQLVEAKIKEAFSGIKTVAVINGVSDALIEEARAVLQRRRR
ncbi:NifU family protein [Lachnospiraceae bacterium ZAX-1]